MRRLLRAEAALEALIYSSGAVAEIRLAAGSALTNVFLEVRTCDEALRVPRCEVGAYNLRCTAVLYSVARRRYGAAVLNVDVFRVASATVLSVYVGALPLYVLAARLDKRFST